ncbi:DUF2188 domain-containing protein [Domibacillus indicus]|uniref:DUF2188 domain-containing protein n=1 Tax=Domibacillus indicus TaxID=1437523 RepID=UPI00203F3F93|nr:DUF2188 domain-containing protein [Domibacillus indicus]MCM3787075.1 DUF2188 domain-containing protein [Domibacillus indicus]
MPWNKNEYPASMKNLPDHIRDKAIEIANALLGEGYEEGRSIAIAIDRARSAEGKKDEGRPRYEVKHEEERWVLKKENGKRAIRSEGTKQALLEEAKEYVKQHEGILTIYQENGEKAQTLYE